MRCTIILLLFILDFSSSHGQLKGTLPVYFSLQFNKTVYDNTLPNNPWSIGGGLQVFVPAHARWVIVLEGTEDIYLEDDKVNRLDPEGKALPSVGTMTNVFAGAAYFVGSILYFSVEAGPSFISPQRLLGIKPSVGVYFSKSQHTLLRFSFINVFNRGASEKANFGSYSVGLSFRLI